MVRWQGNLEGKSLHIKVILARLMVQQIVHVTVSGSILQLADDDSTSTLNLEKKRRDDRLWWLASMLIFAGALV
jgi:hypothetical protein